MKYFEKHPMVMIVIGVIGISMSAILIRFSTAPSAVTASWRLLWTVILMSPVVFGTRVCRRELLSLDRRTMVLSIVSGVFLAIHFWFWFESLRLTSVASASTIVSTEVIWVSIGFFLFLKGKLSLKAVGAIAVAFAGSAMIALADSGSGSTHLRGDLFALLAAMAVAVYMLIGRTLRANVSNTVYTYIVYAACAAGLLYYGKNQWNPLILRGRKIKKLSGNWFDTDDVKLAFSPGNPDTLYCYYVSERYNNFLSGAF